MAGIPVTDADVIDEAPKEANLEAEEQRLIGQVRDASTQEQVLEEQLEEATRTKERLIGGLLTIRSLLGKDALGQANGKP